MVKEDINELGALLEQCKKLSNEALKATLPRAQTLCELIDEYQVAVQGIQTTPNTTESNSVGEAVDAFDKHLNTVKDTLVKLTDAAQEDLQSSLSTLFKNSQYVTIALFGRTRAGKSTTLEALTGGSGESIGVGKQHTTKTIKEYFWPPGQKTLRIVDTPGLEGFEGEEMTQIAQQFVEQADHIFFIITDDKASSGELEHLAKIQSMGKEITILLNMKKADADLDLVVDFPEFLYDEDAIAGHKQRITNYLERHHNMTNPVILPIHARAAWLSTQADCAHDPAQLRQISRIESVEERIQAFIHNSALAARVKSPRQAVRSHVVTVKDELRVFAGQFRQGRQQTEEQHKRLKSAIWRAAHKSTYALSNMKKVFQAADDEIPILVDGLISQGDNDRDLETLWSDILKTSGVANVTEKYTTDVMRFFHDEFQEEVRQLEFDAKINTNLGGASFDRVDEHNKNKGYRRLGRAAVQAASGAGTSILTGWAISNFWNPTGWAAAAGVVISLASSFIGVKGGATLAGRWKSNERRALQQHRNELIRNLRDGLWSQYKQTNDACYKWLRDHEAMLKQNMDVTLGEITLAQQSLWRLSVESLSALDVLLDELDHDVIQTLTRHVIPEIADDQILIQRVARWEGQHTKILLDPRETKNAIGRCIGKGGERVRRLSQMLGKEHITFVNMRADPQTQIAQALGPAKVNSGDVDIHREIPVVRLRPQQSRLAIGAGGSNVRTAENLLQIKKIKIQHI